MARAKLCDVIVRANTKVDKDNTDLIYYVGGEHFEPGNVTVENKGLIAGSTIGPMFYYGFRRGQFLLVSRNPHLKKAGVVDFDGICSEKTFVLETADPSVLLPEYLPFVLQNDTFWDYAVEHKHGSTNFFINWSTLANYEFELPSLEVQKRISKLAWAAHNLKKSYRKQLVATDDLVKSQFIEMFGECKRAPLGDFITQVRGVSYKPVDLSLSLDEEHITLLRANNISEGIINFGDVQYVSRKKVSEVQVIRPKDILMCASSGSLEHVGKAALCQFSGEYTFGAFCKLIRATGVLAPEYIASYMNGDEYRTIIMELAQGTNINNLRNEHIDRLMIPIPNDVQQIEFIRFLKQSDKSKFVVSNRNLSRCSAMKKK